MRHLAKRSTLQRLKESEARYRYLIDASPFAIVMITNRRTVFVNDQAVTLFGAGDKSALMAKSPLDLFPMTYHEILSKRVSNIEEKIVRMDGTVADVEVSTAPFLDDGENAVQVIVRDVTARNRAQEELRALTGELEQRVLERTEALAGSRQRLRALLSDLTLAEERERRRLAVELHDYLAQTLTLSRMRLTKASNLADSSVLKELIREARLSVDESLTYTRTLMAELSPRLLYDVGLAAALRWLGERMGRHGLRVTVSGEPDRLVLPEDQAILVFQCVREVLWNVVKHANATTVTLTYSAGRGELILVVTDDGKGFDPKVVVRGGATGTQFGLFSVRERFELEEGRLEIESSPGRGSRVTMRLPITEPCEVKTPTDGVPPVRGDVKSNTETIRVALVDDHRMVRQGLRSVLQDHPELTIVGEAGDGLEAVEMAQRTQPDVVVMDLNLPVLNGIEATKRIVHERPDTIVIGLSFGVNTYITDAMKAAGAVTCITKERAVEDLYQAIKDSMCGS
jgi:PAS domain S-box-containing protein